jgi:hypothetical protein
MWYRSAMPLARAPATYEQLARRTYEEAHGAATQYEDLR